jgi:hypothetical protein
LSEAEHDRALPQKSAERQPHGATRRLHSAEHVYRLEHPRAGTVPKKKRGTELYSAVPIDNEHVRGISIVAWPLENGAPKPDWKQGTDTFADIRPGSFLERSYEERQKKPDDLEAQEGQRSIAIHALENLIVSRYRRFRGIRGSCEGDPASLAASRATREARARARLRAPSSRLSALARGGSSPPWSRPEPRTGQAERAGVSRSSSTALLRSAAVPVIGSKRVPPDRSPLDQQDWRLESGQITRRTRIYAGMRTFISVMPWIRFE